MTTQQYNESVNEYTDGLFRYALKLAGNNLYAEDVVQTVFEKAWKKKSEIRFETCRGLYFRMAHNLVIDRHRKNKRHNSYLEVVHNSNVDNASIFESKDLIQKAFKNVREKYKSIILLRDYEGYSYDEISDILNLTLSQVKVNLFRARKELKVKIEELDPFYKTIKSKANGC